MPTDRATAERALRRAHEAGDVESARKIAGYLKSQPAPQAAEAERSLFGRERGGFLSNLLPSPEGREFMAESAGALAGMAGDAARSVDPRYQAGITESHYRNIANLPGVRQTLDAIGLPVDPPSAEAQAEYATEALGAGLGAAGRGVLGGAEAVLKSRMRRGMPIPEAKVAQHEEAAKWAAAGATDPRSVLNKLATEAAKAGSRAGGIGTAGGLAAEFAMPGAGVIAGTVAGGAAFTVNALMRMQPTARNLLVNNPKFAAWTLSAEPSKTAQVAGIAAGEGLAHGGAVTAESAIEGARWTGEQMADLLAIVEETPALASAVRQFLSATGQQEQP